MSALFVIKYAINPLSIAFFSFSYLYLRTCIMKQTVTPITTSSRTIDITEFIISIPLKTRVSHALNPHNE